jgi:hypothetical protein
VSPLANSAHRFCHQARRLQNCCTRVEKEFMRGRLQVSDVELVYTSSFLSIVARWEAFLEEALLQAVCAKTRTPIASRRLVRVEDKDRLRDVLLFPDRDYVSLTSVTAGKKMYGLFLRDSRPFSAISEQNLTYIQQAIFIRNAIAHESAHALGQFKKKVPGVEALASNRRNPGNFLRHEFRQAPSQRRLDLYCGAFLSAASNMEQDCLLR